MKLENTNGVIKMNVSGRFLIVASILICWATPTYSQANPTINDLLQKEVEIQERDREADDIADLIIKEHIEKTRFGQVRGKYESEFPSLCGSELVLVDHNRRIRVWVTLNSETGEPKFTIYNAKGLPRHVEGK